MNLCEEKNKPTVIEMLSQAPADVLGYLSLIEAELRSASEKHPEWPSDHIHQAGIVGEESGELTKAALQFYYEGKPRFRMHEEAIQVAAMALRFLVENHRSEFEVNHRKKFKKLEG